MVLIFRLTEWLSPTAKIVIPSETEEMIVNTRTMALSFAMLGAFLLAPAEAKLKPKALYTSGTLDIAPGTRAEIACDEREFVIAWRSKIPVLHVPFTRILFLESAAYRPRTVLGSGAMNSDRDLKFMTVIFQDDWNRTALLQLQLERDYREIPERLRSLSKLPLHHPPAEVTNLAHPYGEALPTSVRRAKLWSASAGAQRTGSPALLKLAPSAPLQLSVGNKSRAIPYSSITSMEFSQLAKIPFKKLIILGAMTDGWAAMLMRKQVRHLLSITYVEDGVPQVVVLELPKYSARTLILELEMRSGKKVETNLEETAAIYG